MSGGCLIIPDPLFADSISSFNQARRRQMSVFDHNYDPSIEIPLRMIYVGYAWSCGGDHVLNSDFCPLGIEDWVPVRVLADRHQILEDKEIRHLGGRDQAHQIQIKIRITRSRH